MMRRRFAAALFSLLSAALVLGAFAPAASAHDSMPGGGATPVRIDLPNAWQPEGIAAGRGSSLFVGSLANGAIWRGDARTMTGSVLVPGASGMVAVGLEYEARHNRLWVAGGATGQVRVYDAGTGALVKTYSFAPAGFLNDLVVTGHAVYVTDSGIQQLDVIPLGEDGALPDPSAATTLPLTGDISFVANQFNANGIVAKGHWLIIVQSNTGDLFRVDPKTGATLRIDLGGATVTNGDGLLLHGSRLYVVRNQNNEIDVLKLRHHLLSAKLTSTITSAGFDTPTTIAFQRGRLWAANARFSTPPAADTAYWITGLRLRSHGR
jgi:sugar lactone lactonase YvrE